jgi:molybdopterin-containing oxidoreductase family iron-sulfur binding subunit
VTTGKPPACTQVCNHVHLVPKDQAWIKVYQPEKQGGGSYFLPRICMQCENAPCVNVCPVGASYRNPEGVVLIDHRLCVGCRLCMAACPYSARYFNWGEPENPPGASEDRYMPEFPIPHRRGTPEKCMLCAHRTGEGQIPACAQGCPMKALYLGDLVQDVATNGVEVRKLSYWLAETGAYRLLEELGTRPRVWYIPGHGEEFGRHTDDRRQLIEVQPQQEPGSDV